MLETKKQLRTAQLKRIHHFLRRDDADQLLESLYQRLFIDPDFLNSQMIGITLSMADELDTQPIINRALQSEKQVVIPRTLPKRQMEFVLYNGHSKLETTKFGTTEPVGGQVVSKNEIDVLIVPGLAFSKNHYRVGYGGGFYDRFLKGFNGTSIAVAMPPQLFEAPSWTPEDFDVLIDKIIY